MCKTPRGGSGKGIGVERRSSRQAYKERLVVTMAQVGKARPRGAWSSALSTYNAAGTGLARSPGVASQTSLAMHPVFTAGFIFLL